MSEKFKVPEVNLDIILYDFPLCVYNKLLSQHASFMKNNQLKTQ